MGTRHHYVLVFLSKDRLVLSHSLIILTVPSRSLWLKIKNLQRWKVLGRQVKKVRFLVSLPTFSKEIGGEKEGSLHLLLLFSTSPTTLKSKFSPTKNSEVSVMMCLTTVYYLKKVHKTLLSRKTSVQLCINYNSLIKYWKLHEGTNRVKFRMLLS